MIKELTLFGLGIAMKDANARKVMFNVAKNGAKMVASEVKKSTGVDLNATFEELTKDEDKLKVLNKIEESEIKK